MPYHPETERLAGIETVGPATDTEADVYGPGTVLGYADTGHTLTPGQAAVVLELDEPIAVYGTPLELRDLLDAALTSLDQLEQAQRRTQP
jgi:hypothetical protein